MAAAEQQGGDQSAILLDTGDALLTLGDEKAAMDRFARALDAPDANRVEARLAIARLMVRYGKDEDAKQQISLAFAESRIGEAPPVTAENLIEAANLLLAMHDFDLATRYFQKAQQAGARREVVAIGLANTYLAQGKTKEADAELASLGADPAANQNYDYLLAQSEVYRQRHQSWNAMMVLAQADQLGANEIAQLEGMQVAGEEGLRVTDHLSMLTDFTTGGLYDDYTVYVLDQQIFGLTSKSANLPPPRSQQESLWTTAYRYHFDNNFPMLSGFFQIRNATGEESLPQEALIINRNTFDYNFNTALNPVVHLGNAWLAFNTGLAIHLAPRQLGAAVREPEPVPPVRVRQQQLVRQLAVVQRQPVSRGRPIHRDRLQAGFQRCRQHAAIHGGASVGQDRADHRLYPPRPDVQPVGAAVLHHLCLRRPAAQVLGPKTDGQPFGRVHPRVPRAGHTVGHGPCSASGRNDPVQREPILERGWSVRLRRRSVFSEVRQHVQQFLHHLCKTTAPDDKRRHWASSSGVSPAVFGRRPGRAISIVHWNRSERDVDSSRFSFDDFLAQRGSLKICLVRLFRRAAEG